MGALNLPAVPMNIVLEAGDACRVRIKLRSDWNYIEWLGVGKLWQS